MDESPHRHSLSRVSGPHCSFGLQADKQRPASGTRTKCEPTASNVGAVTLTRECLSNKRAMKEGTHRNKAVETSYSEINVNDLIILQQVTLPLFHFESVWRVL